jgi:hypothetical protein
MAQGNVRRKTPAKEDAEDVTSERLGAYCSDDFDRESRIEAEWGS